MSDLVGKYNPLEQFLAWMTLLNAWQALSLATIVGGLLFCAYRMNRNRDSPFSIADALEDPMTNKTSLQKCMVLGCFIGCWLTSFYMLLSHNDVTNFVLIILAAFVGKQAFDRGMEVLDPRVKAQAFNIAPGSQPKPPPPVAPAAGPDVVATLNVNEKE